MKLPALVVSSIVAVACSKPSETRAEAAPPPAESGQPSGQSRAEGKGYLVDTQPPEGTQAQKESVSRVVLRTTGAYHINEDFPISLEVRPPADVAVKSPKLGKKEAARFERTEAVFEVKGTPASPGSKRLEATFRFAVCTETTCDPHKVVLAWNIDVR